MGHFTLVEKHLGEYLLISFDASLGKYYTSFWNFHLLGLMDSVESGQKSIILKCIGPSVRILIILVKQIMIVGVLPLVNRFCNQTRIGEMTSQKVEKNGLSTADVAFD